jgi:hypothetical protein
MRGQAGSLYTIACQNASGCCGCVAGGVAGLAVHVCIILPVMLPVVEPYYLYMQEYTTGTSTS